MKRQIKFRAWDIDNRKMASVRSVHFDTKGEVIGVVLCYCSTDHHHSDVVCHRVHLMESTGLKDKNGKEIYEGDILFRPQEAGLEKNILVNDCIVKGMTFSGDSWERKYKVLSGLENGWVWVQCLYPHNDQGMVRHNDWKTFEIIGNIYENPELLDDKK